MDYSQIKQAMAECGHVVTEGADWAAADAAAFRTFAHFTIGVAHDVAHQLLQFPEHFEAEWRRLAATMHHKEDTSGEADADKARIQKAESDAEASRLADQQAKAAQLAAAASASAAEDAAQKAKQTETERLAAASAAAAANSEKPDVAAESQTLPANVFDATPKD